MKLQQLKYVVKVAEVGNITEASRRLFVSQPSITAAIRDLERAGLLETTQRYRPNGGKSSLLYRLSAMQKRGT